MFALTVAAAAILFVILVVSAIPLNLAVKLLGGRSSILKVILVNLGVWAAGLYLERAFGLFAGLLSFIVMLIIYRYAFDLGWLRAFAAWVLQFVIIAAFVIALSLVGVSLFLA